jgi:hypothetical protein
VTKAGGKIRNEPAIKAAWARARLRDLEDQYTACGEALFDRGDGQTGQAELEQQLCPPRCASACSVGSQRSWLWTIAL